MPVAQKKIALAFDGKQVFAVKVSQTTIRNAWFITAKKLMEIKRRNVHHVHFVRQNAILSTTFRLFF